MPTRAFIRGAAPGQFAYVMATGIVSAAMFDFHRVWLSYALLWLALAGYVLLLAWLIARLVVDARGLAGVVLQSRTMFSSFAFVAANGVLGVRLLMDGQAGWATFFWVITAISWVALVYQTFMTLFFMNDQPLQAVVHGGWLTAAVGTQALAYLSALLGERGGAHTVAFLASSYMEWVIGVALYIIMIVLIVERLGFSRVQPAELTAPNWINMGAAAVSTVAGTNLAVRAGQAALLAPAAGTIYAASLGLWAWASWWIPIVVGMGVWRHLVRHHPLAFDSDMWTMVFPLGMYAVATADTSVMASLPALQLVSRVFAWIALAAWTGTFLHMVGTHWPRRGKRLRATA